MSTGALSTRRISKINSVRIVGGMCRGQGGGHIIPPSVVRGTSKGSGARVVLGAGYGAEVLGRRRPRWWYLGHMPVFLKYIMARYLHFLSYLDGILRSSSDMSLHFAAVEI